MRQKESLEEGVNNQKDMIQSMHEEHKERLGTVESRHKTIGSVNINLESTIMELQVCPIIRTDGCLMCFTFRRGYR